jgi:hypothetical protein
VQTERELSLAACSGLQSVESEQAEATATEINTICIMTSYTTGLSLTLVAHTEQIHATYILGLSLYLGKPRSCYTRLISMLSESSVKYREIIIIMYSNF